MTYVVVANRGSVIKLRLSGVSADPVKVSTVEGVWVSAGGWRGTAGVGLC
jgi:hypothetical protein